MKILGFFLLVSLVSATAASAQLVLHAQITPETSYVHEQIWVHLEAENRTDSTLHRVYPLGITNPPIVFDICDSSGESVLGWRFHGDRFVRESDTLAAHGRQSYMAQLGYYGRFYDSVAQDNYLPPGSYIATFKWYYRPGQPVYVEDSASFCVLAPLGVEAEAMEAYRAAVGKRGRSRGDALWSCYQAYRNSRYADECLDHLVDALGAPDSDPSLDRYEIAKRLAIDYPNHPTAWGVIKMVYQHMNDKAAVTARQAMEQVLDSVPKDSRAGRAAAKFLRDGLPPED